MKPRLFIGSSVEGLPIARAIKSELDGEIDVKIWDQGIFKLSYAPLEILNEVLNNSDFASFVFLPEDKLEIKGKQTKSIRDNVVFELGLFYGKLGRERVSFIMPDGFDFHLPTDLTGVVGGTFEYPSSDLQASVKPYCNKIREQVKGLKIIIPANGDFGDNILSEHVTEVKRTASFKTIVPTGLVAIVRIEGIGFAYDVGTMGKWRIKDYEGTNKYVQFLQATGPFDDDMCIRFFDEYTINIQVFENDIHNKPIINKDVRIAP